MYYGAFVSLRHFPAVPGIVTGYKSGERPDNYYSGSYGTYVAPLIPASTILVLEINGGYAQFDVYKQLKELTNNKRFTKNFIRQLEQKLEGETFMVDNNFALKDFEEILQKHL